MNPVTGSLQILVHLAFFMILKLIRKSRPVIEFDGLFAFWFHNRVKVMALIFAAVSFKQASVLSLLPSKHLFSPHVVPAETRLHSGTTLVLLLLVDVAFLKEAADPASPPPLSSRVV